MSSTAEERERVLHLLEHDDVFFCQNALKIVNKAGRTVPFLLRPAQLRLAAALRAQREAGQPERIVILKARQIGGSTFMQGSLVRRATRRPNYRSLTVAHDNTTASSLFAIGELMIAKLPSEIRPEIESQRNALGQKYLKFGRRSRQQRLSGDVGLNSELAIDTAKEASGGRGLTRHGMHLSELAFWEQVSKLDGLLNSVPDEPGTLIAMESTANGYNIFKEKWDMAVAGDAGYVAFFSPWFEEEAYRLEFATPEARAEFVDSIGSGPWGEDEPRLVEQFGLSPEQLAWRRRTIVARCGGSIDRWNAEYPASPEDAFIATGRTVFSKTFIMRVIGRTERTDPQAEQGLLTVGLTRDRLVGGVRQPVPASALWVPRSASGFGEDHAWWRLWGRPQEASTIGAERARAAAGEVDEEQLRDLETAASVPTLVDGSPVLAPPEDHAPVPAGAYVVFVDVAGGEENTIGEGDWHVIQVIDHRTLKQVAEYRSRVDADLLAEQAVLAGYFFNEALIAVETTGGYGTPVVKDYLWRKYGYRKLYRRTPAQSGHDKPEPVLGWDTNRRTKPEMVAGFGELLREGLDGIRSRGLAQEVLTFVRLDGTGRTGASAGAHDDRIMAYMGAQQVARIHPPPRAPSAGSGSFSVHTPRNPTTGY